MGRNSVATRVEPKDLSGVIDDSAQALSWRLEKFSADCHFSDEQALLLANAHDHLGFAVDWHRAEQMLLQGCSHDLVFRILADEAE